MFICFVIPAYEPNHKLITLIDELIERSTHPIIIVDDGSKNKSVFNDPLFSNTQITLLRHAQNLGKGAALKTAFNYILVNYPNVMRCVTLDADGQHSVDDIIRISRLDKKNDELLLGVRNFNFKDKSIPLKSRIGNLFTRSIWRIVSGKRITDTQTGLRRIPSILMAECLQITANRYEFEMEMLLMAQNMNIEISEIPIKTIYIDDNNGSHFNPVFDSLKIYFVIFRFCLSSLFSYFVDYILFFIFLLILPFSLNVAFVSARLIAGGILNFNLNKYIVFKYRKRKRSTAIKYTFLLLVNSYLGVIFINYIEVYNCNAFLTKLLVDCILFFFNFFLQREWVFKKVEGARLGA